MEEILEVYLNSKITISSMNEHFSVSIFCYKHK